MTSDPHSHAHGAAPQHHGGVKIVGRAASVVSTADLRVTPGLSILRLSLGVRLVVTVALIALVWGAILLAKA